METIALSKLLPLDVIALIRTEDAVLSLPLFVSEIVAEAEPVVAVADTV